MKKYKIAMAAALVLCFTMVSPGLVQAFNSHDYLPAPAGTNFLIWYYQTVSGVQYYVDDKRTSDLDVHANIILFRMVHFGKLWGTDITIDPQFLMPFGYQYADGLNGSSGTGDLMLVCTFWFYEDAKTKTYFGVTPYIFVPTGDYDSSRALNLGGNRWSGMMELGFSKGLGNWWLDLGANVRAYTDNNRYGASNLTQKKDPTYGLEAHLTYDFTKNMFLGMEYFYAGGGKTEVNGSEESKNSESHTLGVTSGLWLNPQFELMTTYRLCLSERNGLKGNTFEFRFLYAF